jgi:hypothetical protein|nr:MAG TPA: hypothetical protein [Caudoviricetes sp.]
MIRIIDTLQAQSLDRQDGVWHRLALIPATATIERSEKVEEAGRLATIKINASLSESSEVLRDDLVIKVGFCHGGGEIYGSEDLPLTFEISETNILKISCAYQFPIY